MPFSVENKLVIAVSSRALFDLDAENKIFEEKGEKAYADYQWAKREEYLKEGVAFPFIKRILQFNDSEDEKKNPVEVIVLSKNDPCSGLRFFNSCKHYGLGITRGVFTAGKSPYGYMDAFNCCLFLSANKEDVREAIDQGKPAGLILPTSAPPDPKTHELRVAFDFDGVLADDSAEKVYQKGGIDAYRKEETENAEKPLPPGPLKALFDRLSYIQRIEQVNRGKDASYRPRLRIAIVTARNAPAHERLIITLKSWGITAVEAFFLGGLEKKKVLEIFRPHLFFDDQRLHLEPASSVTPSVHIPFGIVNRENQDRENKQ